MTLWPNFWGKLLWPDVCCSLVDSCLLLYYPAFVKKSGTGKFILHPKAADNPLTAVTVFTHTCDISRFRRELPIWSLSSRSHSRETKPPDESFFQCHFSRNVFLSEHFIFYGRIYLANNLFIAQKCRTFIDLIDVH